MIRMLFSSGDTKTALITVLLSLPVILLALTVHEVAHGYVAYRCGDGTAKAYGRLTLNPTKHLDLMGTLCMLLVGFGWAKPVPVNSRYFRKPKRDMVLVALAGPVSNLLTAVVAAFIYALITALGNDAIYRGLFFGDKMGLVLYYVATLFYLMVHMNLGLALFNLIPIPPLDGSKILAGLLPSHLAMRYVQIERYSGQIMLIVAVLSVSGVLSILLEPLFWAREAIADGLFSLFINIFI